MKSFRSIVAVVFGYFLFAASAAGMFALSGRNPHARQDIGFMAFAVLYGMLFAWLGGRFAARIALVRPPLHANIVAALIALGAMVSLATSPATEATWSQWTAIIFMVPCAFLGGVPTPPRVKKGQGN
ncbi:MAG: hypothetical protein ABJC26_03135 [Gemmatimonadaceae bacterium]